MPQRSALLARPGRGHRRRGDRVAAALPAHVEPAAGPRAAVVGRARVVS